MAFPNRPIAFVLAASNHGCMIVNRNDYLPVGGGHAVGVGFQIMCNSCFDADEVRMALALLNCRRRHFGDGVVALDGGANIGVHTVEWARHMHGWGSVLAFEAQEVVFYALAGNIVLNNCLNARARLAVLAEASGDMPVAEPDYFAPASFGSLELRPRADSSDFGQKVSRENRVPMVHLDGLGLGRVDLVKIDVEGMEGEVLRGARNLLRRERPILIVEAIKSDPVAIPAFCAELGYGVMQVGINYLAVHADDPTRRDVVVENGMMRFAS